jgi:hypothetical protein
LFSIEVSHSVSLLAYLITPNDGWEEVALVLAAEDIDLDAEPEEGKQAEVAAALDALADTEEKARKAEKAATEVTEQAEKKLSVLEDAVSSGSDGQTVFENRERGESSAGGSEKVIQAGGKDPDKGVGCSP